MGRPAYEPSPQVKPSQTRYRDDHLNPSKTSMPAAPETGRVMINVARALGRRAIVSAGWADCPLWMMDLTACPSPRSISMPLFPRVAAVVHHGGAGTTTTTIDSLTAALKDALQPDVAAHAQSLATAVRTDGATTAAQHVMNRDRRAPGSDGLAAEATQTDTPRQRARFEKRCPSRTRTSAGHRAQDHGDGANDCGLVRGDVGCPWDGSRLAERVQQRRRGVGVRQRRRAGQLGGDVIGVHREHELPVSVLGAE
jgi:hypothetical protein